MRARDREEPNLLLRLLGMDRDALGTAAGCERGLLFCARPGGVWMTPLRALTMPLMASGPPWRAPISPVTPAMPGREAEAAAPPSVGGMAPPPTPIPPFTCCGWGGLCATEGGVEREELLLLWPQEVSWETHRGENHHHLISPSTVKRALRHDDEARLPHRLSLSAEL